MPVRLPAAALRWGPPGAGRLPGPLSHLGVSTVAGEVGRGPPCGLGPSSVDWGSSPTFGRAQRVGVGVCRGHEGAHPEGCPARPGKGQLQLQGLRALRPVSIWCGAPWPRPSSHVGVFGGRGREPSVSACSQRRLLLGCPTPGRPAPPRLPSPPPPPVPTPRLRPVFWAFARPASRVGLIILLFLLLRPHCLFFREAFRGLPESTALAALLPPCWDSCCPVSSVRAGTHWPWPVPVPGRGGSRCECELSELTRGGGALRSAHSHQEAGLGRGRGRGWAPPGPGPG